MSIFIKKTLGLERWFRRYGPGLSLTRATSAYTALKQCLGHNQHLIKVTELCAGIQDSGLRLTEEFTLEFVLGRLQLLVLM